MSAFSQRVDAARNGGTMNIEQEKPAATTAAGIGMGRESAFTRAVRNARGGTLDEVEMPQAKTPVDPEPGFWQRVFKTASGGVKQSASQYSDAARAQYEASQGGRTQRTMDELRDIEWAVANAKYAYDTAQDVGAKQSSQNALNANLAKLKAYAEVLGDGAYDVVLREAYDTADKLGSGDAKSLYAGLAGFDPGAFNGVQQQATAATAQMADQLQQSAAEDIAQAKQGLGAAGQTLVDAGVAGTQLLGDAAANLIAPGMGKVALAQRVFGGSTQEARQHGANLAQQMGYGAANAALELLTESMFDGLAGIYGGGAADDVVEAFIQKATGRPAGRAALRVLAGAAGEGAEELVSGIVNPFLQTIYNSDALRESYGNGNLKETVSGLLYDALIGTILGTVGGGANAVKRYGADAKTTTAPDGAALGAEAAANGENATTVTTAEESGAEAIVEGERTAAATPAELLVGSIAESAVPSAKQVNTIAKDAAAVRALGIDPNGKTASQLRAEVREALTSKVKPQTEVTAEQTGEVAPQRVNVPVENVNETVDAESSVGAAEHGFDPFTAAQNEYGTLPSGEHPVRPDDVPRSTDGTDRVSQSVVTVKGARVTPDSRVETVERAVVGGKLSHIPGTNRAQVRRARTRIRNKGFDKALQDWTKAVNGGEVNADLVAEGAILLNNAGNSDMSDSDYTEILVTYCDLLTAAGQAVQAARILKTLSPENRLYAMQRSIQRMNEEAERSGAKKRPSGIPTWLWMERAGEGLAERLASAAKGRSGGGEQTVSQQILNDLYAFAMKGTPLGKELAERKAGGRIKRSDLDRIADLFNNPDKYREAWNSARNTIMREYGDDPAMLEALDSWMNTYLDEQALLTKELTGRTDIRIDPELARRYVTAETDEARDAVLDEIISDVARQIPPTFTERFNALRYMAMLGNFKTLIRNTGSNAVMRGVRSAHNAVAVGLEHLLKTDRTRSLTVDKERLAAARAYFEDVKADAMGDAKYTASRSFKSEFERRVQDVRSPFREGGATAKLRDGISWAMNNAIFGDEAFSRAAYSRALAGYMKANGITAEQFQNAEWREEHGELVDKANSFAIKEAQEATFRDNSSLAQLLSKLRPRGDNAVVKAWNAMFDGLFPFRKTPANVATRAVEYSPLGFVKSTILAVKKAKGADISGADIVNEISKNITGTALFGVGMAFAAAGLLRGSEDDDEEQAAFDDLTGHQTYAIELPDGTSFTIDWVTPASIPLFMGAELMAQMQDNGFQLKDLSAALTSVTEPMLELSMLQGVSDAINDVRYAEGSNLLQIAISLALDRLLQIIPTIGGHFERVFEDEGTMTYVDRDSQLSASLQRQIGAASRKIPGWDYNQIPYIDAWGREEERGDVLERAAHNLFNPSYVSQVDVDKLESELQRLYDATGDVAVLPDRAAKSFTMDGAIRYLTAEEYVKFAKASGQDSYRYASEAVQSAAYRSMSDEERSELIGKLYSYAKYKAKKGIEPKYESDTYRKAAEAEKKGISPVEYYIGRMRSDADGNGTTSKSEAQKYLDSQSGLSNAKKVDLWDIICTTGAKNPYQ